MSARPTTSPGRLPARARAGFTLVELLMVLLIIGLLMGLLFPAINSARESGRRTQCINNMTEIGKAIQAFEASNTRYPGWVEDPFGVRYLDPSTNPVLTDSAPLPPYQEILTPSITVTGPGEFLTSVNYFVPLLPSLGREDIFSPGNAVRAWKTPEFVGGSTPTAIRVVAPRLQSIAVCPSDGTKMSSDLAELSYVCSSGRHDEIVDASAPGAGPWDWSANGIFMDLRRFDPLSGAVQNSPRQTVNASYVRKNDGQDTTLLLSESLAATTWFDINNEDGTTFHFFPPDPSTGEAPGPDHGINAYDQLSGAGGEYPSSNHPGGVVVLFAGLNARFITNEIEFRVWVALNTPNGKFAKEPGMQTQSNSFITNQPKLTDADLAP